MAQTLYILKNNIFSVKNTFTLSKLLSRDIKIFFFFLNLMHALILSMRPAPT